MIRTNTNLHTLPANHDFGISTATTWIHRSHLKFPYSTKSHPPPHPRPASEVSQELQQQQNKSALIFHLEPQPRQLPRKIRAINLVISTRGSRNREKYASCPIFLTGPPRNGKTGDTERRENDGPSSQPQQLLMTTADRRRLQRRSTTGTSFPPTEAQRVLYLQY